MADGSRSQSGFNFPLPSASLLRAGEIVVDLFAGGGGASEALKQALGMDPALAYNHDDWAIGMHAANHPLTKHHREDIWHADPVLDVAGRPVGWFHASPDCTHFSQAKGGQPRSRKTRSLSWVVLKWVGQLARAGNAPRIISMENVWQILTWGPLVAKRCKATGSVLKMDGAVAARGERVPVELQQLVPDKRHSGRTWHQFVAALRLQGYVVEWRKLVASDYGAGTSRERLFLLARRDGGAIHWPKPTHGKAPGLLPLVSAADCIDFSDLGRSIFDRKRPLAETTMRRIAKGIHRFVLGAAEPFIIETLHNGAGAEDVGSNPLCGRPLRRGRAAHARHQEDSNGRASRQRQKLGVQPPLLSVWGAGNLGVCYQRHDARERSESAIGQLQTAALSEAGCDGNCLQQRPLGICAAPGKIRAGGLTSPEAAVFLEQACAGYYTGAGHDLRKPAPTICARGSIQRLVSAEIAEPSLESEAYALRIASFLISYYGNGDALNVADPLDTVTTRDRMALVTVTISGTPYVIVDIALRMLRPHELFRAQGFPRDYIIDRTADGRAISSTHAVRMVGNSVSPPPLRSLAEANLDSLIQSERLAA